MAYITTETIRDKVVQDEIMADVLLSARNIGNLDNPLVVKSVSLKGLHGSVAMMGNVGVFENVKELETSGIENAEFDKISFDMKKDRVKIAISDEAQLENSIINVFELQKQDATQALADSFDKQIAAALCETPQADTNHSIDFTGTNEPNVFKTISWAISKIAPYKTTAMCMTQSTFYQILSAIELRGSMCVQNANGTITIPGLPNIPAIISDNIPLNSAKNGRILFVSNEVPAAIKAKGAVITRVYEDEKAGGTIFQSDVFRCIKSNIRKTDNNQYNKGVVSIDVKWEQ